MSHLPDHRPLVLILDAIPPPGLVAQAGVIERRVHPAGGPAAAGQPGEEPWNKGKSRRGRSFAARGSIEGGLSGLLDPRSALQ